jgi:hypothetical protein
MQILALSPLRRNRLKVFENEVLKGIYGYKRDELAGNGDNYIMGIFIVFTLHLVVSG